MKVSCIFASMIVLRVLLFPFAVLFDLVTSIRNKLYDLGLKPSVSFDIPVISVGNLAVGGTGKTPLTEHLIRLIHTNWKVATLSRGYGRRTKGFRIAGGSDDAATIGDEPFQLYRKFHDRATVTVGEERALAIPMLLDQQPEIQVILLDDAYQHRRVRPTFSVLLTDYYNRFDKDFLMPAGKLRESRKSAERADVVIVTKCPDELQDDEMMTIERSLREYCDKPIFFAGIHYVAPAPFSFTTQSVGERVVLVSGIANPKTLVAYVEKNFSMARHFNFADHHAYSDADVKAIANAARDLGACVFATEKDAVKLDSPQFRQILAGVPCFYVPIEPAFIKSGRDFDEIITDVIIRAQQKKETIPG